MVSLSTDQIKDIAQDLDCGFICYINIQTGEYTAVPKDYHWDTDAFDDVVAEIKKKRKLYFEIEPPMPGELFRFMEYFIDTLPDQEYKLKEKLIEALSQPKPFQHFKYVIDNSGPYRDHWFAFKNQQFIEFVKRHLKFD